MAKGKKSNEKPGISEPVEKEAPSEQPEVAGTSSKPTPLPLATETLKPEQKFILEDVFPNPYILFDAYGFDKINSNGVVVSLDTNALLLPYSIGKTDLGAIGTVYKKLVNDNRIFLSAR